MFLESLYSLQSLEVLAPRQPDKQQQENDYKEAFTRHSNRNVRHSMLNTIEGCKTESMVIGGELESNAGTYVLMF